MTLYNGQNASDNTELENVEISNISALKWSKAGKRLDESERERERVLQGTLLSRYKAGHLHQVVSGELVLRRLSEGNLDEPVLRKELFATVLRPLHLLATG